MFDLWYDEYAACGISIRYPRALLVGLLGGHEACKYQLPCGGGFLPHRLSSTNGYDNPSVYCRDLKGIFRHIGRCVSWI